jgi:rod shape-determining protein MreD
MRALKFFVGLVVAVMLHMVSVRVTGGVSLAVDLFLLLALFNALDGNPTAGLMGGFVAGLTADTLTGGLYGLHGFADTLAGYGMAVATRRLVIQRSAGIFLAFSLAAAVQQAILVGLRLLLLPETSLLSVSGLVTRVLGVGVLGFLGYAGRKRWLLGIHRWRSSRMARLR